MLTTLESDLDLLIGDLEKEVGKREAYQALGKDLEEKLASISASISIHDEAVIVFEDMTEQATRKAIEKIEKFVTYGLREIFDDDTYILRVEQEVKHNRLEAHLIVANQRMGREIHVEINKGRGDGLARVAGLLLQIGVLMGTKLAAPVLILDEPITHVPLKTIKRVGAFLREVSDEVQLIVNTTQKVLAEAADTMYVMVWLADGSAGIKE